MPGNSSTPPYDYHHYDQPSNNRRSSPLANSHNIHTDDNYDRHHYRSTFHDSDLNLHERAQQIEHDIKKLQSDLHSRSQGLTRELQAGDRNAIRTMRKLLISTFILLDLLALRNEHKTIMSSIDQALAAVDASCPPMTSSEPDYYDNSHGNGGKENISPGSKHKENVDPVLIDALVKKVNHAITPPSNTGKDRIRNLYRTREKSVFDTRKILDGLPPVVNHNANNNGHDDSLPVEMSMASMDYLRRHNLLPPRNDCYRSGAGSRRSFD